MILTLVEHQAGELSGPSLAALTLARRLAAPLGEELHALAVGPGASEAAAAVGEYGVVVLHAGRYPDDDSYAPRAWARAVLQLMSDHPVGTVVAPSTQRGNEVLAHVGAIAGLPMVSNCTDVDPGPPLRLTRMRWAGSLLEEAVLEVEGTALLSVAPDAVAPEPAPVEVVLAELDIQADPRDLRVRVTQRLEPSSEGVSLTDAKVVIGGGRGVGGAEGFALLEELAGLLGAAVGVSRAVTSLGWRSHKDQIGQTGCRISPDLYIACGISGAIQHMVGCKAARNILAINRDAEAPIMSKADFAVIGDLQVVLPAVIVEVRKVLGSG